MIKYKVDFYNKQEDFLGREYADFESDFYAQIGRLMWDEDTEILGIFSYDLANNRVEKGEIKWDEENKRFYVDWKIVWEA